MTHTLTSRQRVFAALERTPADRVPLDFSANADTLRRLHRDLGAATHYDLLKRLRVDILDLRGVVDPDYVGPVPFERHRADGVRENFWGMRKKAMATATGIEDSYCDFMFSGQECLNAMQTHQWPDADWFDFSSLAKNLQPWREFAVMATGASIFQHPTFLRGLDNLLADMIMAPEQAHFIMDKFLNFYLAYFERMFEAADGQIHIFRIADDLGMQDRLLISPALFEEYFVPRLKKLVEMAHAYDIKVMFHSCGSILPLIEGLIDIGIDILDPLQVTARGMEPGFIKQTFGGQICLHGSIDTQYLLPRGTPQEIRREARKMTNILGENGGFILAPCHVLQTDVPTENILALYDWNL